MAEAIGVRFREIGKIDMFDPGEEKFRRGDHVIAETARGTEFGTVILSNYELSEQAQKRVLKPLVRRASEEDEEKNRGLREKEGEALKICRRKAADHQLEMKVISAEYLFDGSKLLFYFTADGRVDFRELVKDLASVFHMRIELRQVGVRDETKLIGGMGTCGRPLCCSTWLSDFVPVSIKMAKEQNLSLNPQKISGVCGRLMCCLKNEAETYAYLHSLLPKKGDMVELSDGRHGEITEVNVLKQTVKVFVILDGDEREIREVPASETVFIAHRKKGQPSQMKKDAMAKREAAMQEAKKREKKREEAREKAAAAAAANEHLMDSMEVENADSIPAAGKPEMTQSAGSLPEPETEAAAPVSEPDAQSGETAPREERHRRRRRPRNHRKEDGASESAAGTESAAERGDKTQERSEKSPDGGDTRPHRRRHWKPDRNDGDRQEDRTGKAHSERTGGTGRNGGNERNDRGGRNRGGRNGGAGSRNQAVGADHAGGPERAGGTDRGRADDWNKRPNQSEAADRGAVSRPGADGVNVT